MQLMIDNLNVYDEEMVLKSIDKTQVKRVLLKAFEGLSNSSTVQPNQTLSVFPKGAGDCIFYPGVIHDLDLIGVKLSPYINALTEAGKSPVTAYTLLMSATTGQPTLLCDSYALTTLRTAATTALALEYLTPPDAKTLCVIGTGNVAKEHLSYVIEQHDWQEIIVWSLSLSLDKAKAEDFAQICQRRGVTLTVAESAQMAVTKADVVMLCTSSGTPVIETQWLKDTAVVTSISTNVPKAHEISPAELNQFSVFCDYELTAPATAGEMIIAIEDGAWSKDKLKGDLKDLIVGKVERPTTGKVFFRSTGLGLEDLAIASLLI